MRSRKTSPMKSKIKTPGNPKTRKSQNPGTNSGPVESLPELQSAEIPIEQIDLEAETRSRHLNEDVANEYAELMKAGTVFPPILVYGEGDKFYLADGFHRVEAAKRLERPTIPGCVRRGGRLEALEAALGANETHGLRRSNEDKRFAVDKALSEFSDRADRVIAALCHVSPTFVGQRRDKLQSEPATVNVDSSTKGKKRAKRRGRDGKVRRVPDASPEITETNADVPKIEAHCEPPGSEQVVDEEIKMPQKLEPSVFTVIVWDDQGAGTEPQKFYSDAKYPHCALFHIWPTGAFHLSRKGWASYDLLLTLLTGGDLPWEQAGLPLTLNRRLVSVSLRGNVPLPEIAMDDLREFPELLEQIEAAWPAARKALFDIPARDGWNIHTEL